ncbi:MAG: hypothetical protein IK066_05405 [Kiritimatiellae bacterium]|nr:hypothetical protein [Kiritimatiellia bacterium]
MKAIFVAGMALMVVGAAGAKEWRDLSSGEQNKTDYVNWGDGQGNYLANSLERETRERLEGLLLPMSKANGELRDLNEAIAAGVDATTLRDEAAELSGAMAVPFCRNATKVKPEEVARDYGLSHRGNPTSDSRPAQAGAARINNFIDALKVLDGSSRPKLAAMMQVACSQDLFCLNSRWRQAVGQLERSDTARFFEGFAPAYNRAMHEVDMGGGALTFNMALSLSGLDEFVEGSGRLRCTGEAKLHVLDRYLEAIDREHLEKYEEAVKKLKAAAYEAWMTLGADFDAFQEFAPQLHPSDRGMFESYFDLWRKYLDMQEKLLIKNAEEVIAKCQDDSTPVGKLRYMEGENWFRLLEQETGSAGNNGKPGYEKRMNGLAAKLKRRCE